MMKEHSKQMSAAVLPILRGPFKFYSRGNNADGHDMMRMRLWTVAAAQEYFRGSFSYGVIVTMAFQ